MYDLTNVTGLEGLVATANVMSGGTFLPSILGYIIFMITWAVFFVGMKNYSSEHAFVVSTFLMAPIALFLASLGLVNPLLFFIPAGLAALGAFIPKNP